MKTEILRAEERGTADFGWLKAKYYFSFAHYYNPNRMNFNALRVLNDDVVGPGAGFPMHPHNDMEIVTIPLSGSLAHQDSEGNSGLIQRGEVQIMSAGSGIRHSEHNASKSELLKLLQIWIEPNAINLAPRYEQKTFDFNITGFQLLVSPDGRKNSLKIFQEAYFTFGRFGLGEKANYLLNNVTNGVFLMVLKGEIKIENKVMYDKDSIQITDAKSIDFEALTDCEVLLIEVGNS